MSGSLCQHWMTHFHIIRSEQAEPMAQKKKKKHQITEHPTILTERQNTQSHQWASLCDNGILTTVAAGQPSHAMTPAATGSNRWDILC